VAAGKDWEEPGWEAWHPPGLSACQGETQVWDREAGEEHKSREQKGVGGDGLWP
jgi:hypothetical protein